MFRQIGLIACLVAFGSTACAQDVAPEDLPYQRATGIADANGKRVLQNWSRSVELLPGMTERYVPDNPAFRGAEVWHLAVQAIGVENIARDAFSSAGMENVVLLAQRAGSPLAVSLAATDPRTKMTAVMVSGELDGAPAKGIGFVFHGIPDEEPGVSAFMAPSNVFIALGGHVIPEVHWYLGTTESGHDLMAEGSLSPQESVDEASAFFSLWVSAYVVPLKDIQRQSVQKMQSWNTAMNICSGDSNCEIAPTNDGTGNWEAVIGD